MHRGKAEHLHTADREKYSRCRILGPEPSEAFADDGGVCGIAQRVEERRQRRGILGRSISNQKVCHITEGSVDASGLNR